LHLSALFVYPIKSLGGISLSEATLEGKGRGLQHDRRWMLIDSSNRFISQREHSNLATVAVEVLHDRLKLSVEAREPLSVLFNYESNGPEPVQIWNDTCSAEVVSEEANEWFSDLIGEECRLVHMPDDSERPVDKDFALNGDIVGFADAYPFIVLSEASLDDLNGRLEELVTINRFRPNFFIHGADPFAEDQWKVISIGDQVFHVIKPVARCVMTTVDQERGVRSGDEPLRTLASYRRKDNKVLFGQNLIAASPYGTVRVGDPVTVLE
jgi:uncharacterized protein YcbX